MNRLAGIIVAVAGVLVAVLGIARIEPGITSTGVCLLLLGGLVIGLSFVKGPEPDEVERMPTASTLINIFFSPGEVFSNLRRHPRWLVAALIMSTLSAVYANAFLQRLTPEVVTNYAIDKTLESPMMNDQARTQIEAGRKDALAAARNPILRAGSAVNSFVGLVYLFAFLALLYFLFALAMGGTLNYMQAFSIVAYAFFPVSVIRWVLSLVFLYIKDPADIHPIIGANGVLQDSLNILVTPAQTPVLYVLLSSFSVLSLYWIILNIIGLKNGGERISSTIATTATLALWLLGVGISVVFALLFGNFFS
jgi:hypothetical protein